MNGLLSEINVLRTSTAFPVGEVEVVVVAGTEVGGIQSKSLQGQPAEQFS